MDKIVNIDIGGTKVPNIPFLWYREDRMTCPFLYVKEVNGTDIQYILNKNGISIDINSKRCFFIVQENILEDGKLYVSYHSYSYFNDIHKDIVPQNFAKHYIWYCKTYPLKDINFVSGNNNLKPNKFVKGDVHIHDLALSPAEHFKFKVNEKNLYAVMVTEAYCDNFNLNTVCLFIIINSNKREVVKSWQNLVKQIVSELHS